MSDFASPRASLASCSAPMARVERKGGRVAEEGKVLSLTFKTGTPSLNEGIRGNTREYERIRENTREYEGIRGNTRLWFRVPSRV